jgi:Asp-tRNA(Asn)/Glu-tRNA(Gln) amidotransferase A subunit family amidase
LLAGVPIVVKDNIATLEMPTSCGSRILDGYVSPYEATAITRLARQGAVIVANVEHGRIRDGVVHREQRVPGLPKIR